jgi:ligand-binding sensor domain-containing protein
MLRVSFILSALLFYAWTGYCQSSWRIEKLGVTEGLSEGYVYVIHQDKKGFMWIGTHGGLNRYDGYNFRVFQYSPFNFSSLGDNAVFFLKEHPVTGKFWIGGSSCLNEFDPETFTNTRYRYDKNQVEFSDGIFISPYEMLLACEYEVLSFDVRNKTFQEIPVFDENNRPISISRVENTTVDKKGNYMIMSRTGIFFYDPVTKSCKRKTATSPDFSAFNRSEIFNIIQDKKGDYWIATNKKGLIRMNSSSNKTTTLPLPASLNNESLRFDVVMEDSAGNIWAGSSHGLFSINPVTLNTVYFSTSHNADVLLSHPEVNVITEDRNHMMWIGTVGGGINKVIRYNSGFRNFDFSDTRQGPKIGSYVMGLQQLNEDIWFANIWDQVGKVNLKTGRTSLLHKPLLPGGYSWYSEGTITKNKDNELLLLNGESRIRIQEKPPGAVTVESQASPGLSYIFHGKNNKTWHMLKAAVEKTFQRNDTIFGNHFIYDAVEDKAGNIWIGSSSGLIKFNIAENRFTHYRHDDKNRNSISSDFIYALELDNDQKTVWMAAYNGGLCTYDITSGNFRHYTKADGLSDNIVYAIEKDHHGNFWFSSNAGISSYNNTTKSFYNYGLADGLLNHEFNRRSSFKNEAGWIFFGGIAGIDYFHPDSIQKSNTTPNLEFTSFRIFDNDYIPTKENDLPVVALNYDDHYLSIDFASLDYQDQQKIQYAYRMNDDQWIRMGNQHTLSFSDLPPGTHRLSVKSSNREGVWLDNEIQCLIIVHPAWWQTWWFRTGLVVIAVLTLFFFIRLYLHRKLEKQKAMMEKQRAVDKERTRIATDMHDDLGAGLSRIKFLSETIGIKKQKDQPIEEDVTRIREYAHQMIDKMGEIVWALNEKNDSLNDLVAFTRAYCIEYLMQNGITCKVQMPEHFIDCFVSGEFRRNVFLSVKEILHNIVKHAAASQVVISIEIGERLAISIQDDGKGFDPGFIRTYSNGLGNIARRMKEMGGRSVVKADAGTLVSLEVPLQK